MSGSRPSIDPDVIPGGSYGISRFVVPRARPNRIGMLIKVSPASGKFDRALVRFGSSGPEHWYSTGSLHWATKAEVRSAGLSGVGHVEIYEGSQK